MTAFLLAAVLFGIVAVVLGIVWFFRAQRAGDLRAAADKNATDPAYNTDGMRRDADTSESQARLAGAGAGIAVLLAFLLLIAGFYGAISQDGQAAATNGDDNGGTETSAPFDLANVCPNGVDDAENFVLEANDDRLLWQAHGSLEGRSGDEIVGAYYGGDPGYACHQVAQEGKNVAVLLAVDFGLRSVPDVNTEIERIRSNPDAHRLSAEDTAVRMTSFFASAEFEERAEPSDGTWTLATVSIDGMSVVEAVDVPITQPVPAYCGIRPLGFEDDPSASTVDPAEQVCYLVQFGVWAYESEKDFIPNIEGAVELGAEVVEETAPTVVLPPPSGGEQVDSTSPSPSGGNNEEETDQPSGGTDSTEGTNGPDSTNPDTGNNGGDSGQNPGNGDDEGGDGGGGDGQPGGGPGGCQDGGPGCPGTDDGGPGGGGDDNDGDCPGCPGDGGGGDGCRHNCGGGGGSTTTTTQPPTTTSTVPKTTTTQPPTTTSTVPKTTTTQPPTTTSTVPKGTPPPVCNNPPWIPCP